MPQPTNITKIQMDEEFTNCPKCGYDRGFHSVFKKVVDNGHAQWFLVCPSCEGKFDVGLTIQLGK